jgi:hypothetical protein
MKLCVVTLVRRHTESSPDYDADSSDDVRNRQAFSSMLRKTLCATLSSVIHVLFSQETGQHESNSENNPSLNTKYSRNYAASQPKPHDDIISAIPVISEFTQENNEKGGKR